ncbi:hypothetical protein B842_02020 [Corynebacterium humireducens NBRC 106098 = DSM 45392]|uniref:EccD-like transmembrane domain-containing protein n=1 Tax=Corynebacterium humireducens NBRC 106098 = DSM 45392 TaxID=1223515 RepID=A0A0B5D5A7_9CORY|nr:type VII secretion integral membrane protein EccD [Corynebacterium humireducens]AJE32257.1 hypothetical protein B842_02020 [Corynebacterium humireducens NBRC 106098 = DSM 45392]
MSVDHVLRLTTRFQIGTYLREADVAVPAGSTLAEVIPEIVTLVGAPRISRPWLATTAAGTPLGPAVPLHRTSLDHGAVVVLSPRHEGTLPVIRDAAEALVEADVDADTRGLAAAGSVTGTLASLILAGTYLPWSQALALAAGVALLLLLARREVRVLAPVICLLAAGAAAAAVVEAARPEELTHPHTFGWAALSAAATATAVLVLLIVLRGTGPRTAAATATLLGLGAVGAVGAFLPAHAADPAVAAAALVIAAGVVFTGQLPDLVIRVAGLRVPRLPTAGQDLGVADNSDGGDGGPADVDARARRARRLHDGAALGAALALTPALLTVGAHGGGFAQALCVAALGAVALHASRHRQVVPAWSWMSVGFVACLAGVWAATDPGHPAQWVPALACAATALTAPLWVPRVPEVEPTTVVWWEHAESLALAASLPLAAHLAGFFVLIRGLG